MRSYSQPDKYDKLAPKYRILYIYVAHQPVNYSHVIENTINDSAFNLMVQYRICLSATIPNDKYTGVLSVCSDHLRFSDRLAWAP